MIEAMTTAARTARRQRWALALLAAVLAWVLAVAVGVFTAGSASAVTASAVETRVGASHSAAGVVVGLSAGITAGQRLGNDPQRAGIVVATGVAAETAAANTAERTVVMGRNMTDRVIPYATRNSYDWYRGTPGWVPRSTIERISPRALERTDLWFNQRWIRGEMRGDSRIVDIGEPTGYPPSAFYNMERQQVSGYWNYVQDIQP
jgi:hypothetical protein